MLSAQKDGPLPKMAACSKKAAGKTHKNRFKTGMVFRVQDQTVLWIILPPTSPPTLLCLPGFMNSRVFMYLARWGEDVER